MAIPRVSLLAQLSSVFCLTLVCMPAQGQNAVLDSLQGQINQLKKDQAQFRQDSFNKFLQDVTGGASDPEKALDLLKEANAPVPAPNSDSSTPTPEARERRRRTPTPDQPDDPKKGLMAQAHCGLLRFAALFARTPDAAHLKEDWMAWLNSAAQNYPLLGNDELAGKSMKDSPITKNLYQFDFGDKEQGDWSIRKIPELYQKYVLKPLGDANDPRILSAWDAYGGMLNVDQAGDQTKWTTITLPMLTFQKAVAAYKLNPTIDKLAALYQLAKANPNHPNFNDMIDQITTLMADFKSKYAQPPKQQQRLLLHRLDLRHPIFRSQSINSVYARLRK